jgi:hypothetical protein
LQRRTKINFAEDSQFQVSLKFSHKLKSKSKVVRVLKGVWGSGCIYPHFLHLGTSWRWVVSFTPRPLYPRERAPGTHWIGGWMDPQVGLNDVKRKFLTLPGLELQPLDRPACM